MATKSETEIMGTAYLIAFWKKTGIVLVRLSDRGVPFSEVRGRHGQTLRLGTKPPGSGYYYIVKREWPRRGGGKRITISRPIGVFVLEGVSKEALERQLKDEWGRASRLCDKRLKAEDCPGEAITERVEPRHPKLLGMD